MGAPLCPDCKFNIGSESFSGCVVCSRPISARGVCVEHMKLYEDGWCVGPRDDALEQLINGYKFGRKRANHLVLGELLDSTMAELPTSTVLVPIPTVRRHIRQRGYDHALLIAQYIATRRGLICTSLLKRRTQTVQLGASKRERRKQAAVAFACDEILDDERLYVLVDDVFTTGATMEYAAKELKRAGARHVAIAVATRQPLD